MSWQSQIFSLKDKIAYLKNSNEMSDVTLLVGSERKPYQAHKLLLSLFSEVFQAMFYGPMADGAKEVALPDDDIKAIEIFLCYVYTDIVPLESIEDGITALYFAEKYMVLFIKNISITYLKDNITSDFVIDIYEAAKSLDQTELQIDCWEFIKQNTYDVLRNKNFKFAKFETAMEIVCEDDLILPSELHMYNAIVEWGKEQCNNGEQENLRQILDPLLRQVRFLTMTGLEFAGSPCEDGILTQDEQLEIFKEMFVQNNVENDRSERILEETKEISILQAFSTEIK
ncbi:BTB/POZ domain-containing protein 2-like [Centruroides sculpturatus]|uniref:BTB/POZ domain-containing protein 2-like n=1 Tax=Centruroides sculpturatus TaxID=218467 RepID=UPI000C6D0BA9|nr:BTB/POZ domain-containing protein 2-like [Centruroides sculpturatus]